MLDIPRREQVVQNSNWHILSSAYSRWNSVALSFFADIGTKKKIPFLTWTMQYHEATCERLFKKANHIGTLDRMARIPDDVFEMLVMAQYNTSQHGGVETIEVSRFK